MDKIFLKDSDVTMLNEWKARDNNANLIAKCPPPFRAIELILGDELNAKVIRNNEKITVYINKDHKKLGKFKFKLGSDGKIIVLEDDFPPFVRTYNLRVVLIYLMLMAFIVYEKPELESTKEISSTTFKKNHNRFNLKKQKQKLQQEQVTYIIKRKSERENPTNKEHRASPKGIFTVRGHYRHYKTGKTIWIPEYKKGTGEAKNKTYKI